MSIDQLAPSKRALELSPGRGSRHETATVVAVLLTGVLVLALWAVPPGDYVSAQWLFSYTDGLWSRSLVGTLFRLGGGEVERDLVAVAVVLYLVVLVLIARPVARWLLDEVGRPRVATPLVLGVALAPTGLPALAASLGRLDTSVVVCAVVALLSVRRSAGRWSVVAVALSMVTAVLVHEAALLMVVPWVCAFLAHRRASAVGDVRAMVEAGLAAVPALLLVLVTSMQVPASSQAAIADRLGAGVLDDYARHLAAGIHVRGIVDNMRLVGSFFQGSWETALVASVVSIVPVVLLAVLTLRRAGLGWRDLQRTQRLMVGASAAPLLLSVIGYDWGRWFAASATLSGLTALIILHDHRGRVGRPTPLLWVGCAFAIGLTLLVGGTQEHALGLTYVH